MKPEKRYPGSMVAVLAGICVAALALALFNGCGGKGSSPVVEEPGVVTGYSSGMPVAGAFPTASESVNSYVYELNGGGGIKPPDGIPKVSLEEAEEYIGADLRVPRETLGGTLDGCYNWPSESPDNNSTSLVYSSGFSVLAEVYKKKIDFRLNAEADIAAAKRSEEDPLYTRIGAIGHVVEVAGFEMLAYPPFELPGEDKDGKTYSLPPNLNWWDDGIRYVISPMKLGFTEELLIKIAESMY